MSNFLSSLHNLTLKFVEVTLFCTFNHVQSTCDLTLYCVLSKIAEWRNNHNGDFPETLYIQCDGGCENANKYLLGLLEFIVVKRMAKKIILTRLPVGHTHDDMDAIFGLLWKWMSGRIFETVEAFKKGVEEAFSHHQSRLKATVKLVNLVPNYQSFFEGSIDGLLSRYTKEQQTQHRWCFEAVDNSVYFPFGVKTMYKAYASDKVVEIHKIPKTECVTPLGRLTGLEPRTTYSAWYLREETIVNRYGVEGFYLLTKIPFTDQLLPCEFDVAGVGQYQTLHRKLRHFWQYDDPKRIWWEDFFISAPSGTATDYMNQHSEEFIVPLSKFFRKDIYNHNTHSWRIKSAETCFGETPWPSELAACMPSVVTTFTRHPGPTRILATNDASLNNRLVYFSEHTKEYYEDLKQLTINMIMDSIVKMRWTSNGELVHSVDSKATVINAIKRDDVQLFKLYFRTLSEEASYLVNKQLFQSYYRPRQSTEAICSLRINDDLHDLSFQDYRSMRKGSCMSPSAMNYCQLRNQSKQQTFHRIYDDCNKDKESYLKLKEVLFASSVSLQMILDRSIAKDWNAIKDYASVIIPIYNETDLYWMCIIIDIKLNCLYCYNPANIAVKASTVLRSIVTSFSLPGNAWSMNKIPSKMFNLTLIDAKQDSGIIVVSIILFYSQSCPMKCIQSDIDIFRMNYCWDILC